LNAGVSDSWPLAALRLAVQTFATVPEVILIPSMNHS